MKVIRCLLIDDEPLAHSVLENFIQRVNYLTLVAKCDNAVAAFDVFQHETIDLIFTDIQMPQITGIEFVKSLQKAPFVIFTTAYPEYALEGFNLDAVDYLLKPIAFDRFLRSVQKVKNLLLINQGGLHAVEPSINHIFVKEDYKLVKINHDDILYVQGLKDYVKIITGTKTVITHITMKRLIELLPSSKFKQVHKSFIVRLEAITAVNGNEIEIISKAKIPIGLQYRDLLMNILKNTD